MNFDRYIDISLNEDNDPQINLQRYKLYIDLNDCLLKAILHGTKIGSDEVAKNNPETVTYILANNHKYIYNDLNNHEVEKVKNLFRNDFMEKKNTEYALDGLDNFTEHWKNTNEARNK